MDNATNYEQWSAAAEMLDIQEGKPKWKDDPVSVHYEYQLIADRLAQLRKARESGDLSSMQFLLRTSLCRNLGDMGNENLYKNCRVGTKKLIEDYISEVCTQLELICESTDPEFSSNEKYEFFLNTQNAFGRSALLLSGGAIFGLAHIGVVKSLFEAKLLPRIISGSSVGSIIAAVICTRNDEELPVMLDPKNVNLDVFERPSERGGWLLKLSRMLHSQMILDIEIFIEAMRFNVGDLTFLEAFFRTRRILNVTVSSSTHYEMPRLLNYLTAPNVVIWSAVSASCAIPGVYRSSPLMYKDKAGVIRPWNPSGHKWIDGSVENDLPMARISELFGVNHFLVSQVNPHVLPVLRLMTVPYFGKMIKSTSFFFWSEIQHWLNQLIDLGVSWRGVKMAQSIVKQKYKGDITIVPPVPLYKLSEIMGNPQPDMILEYTILGERATWSLVSTIKNHCQIELFLDTLLSRLKIRKLESLDYNLLDKSVMNLEKLEIFDANTIRAFEGDDNDTGANIGRAKDSVNGKLLKRTGSAGMIPGQNRRRFLKPFTDLKN